MKRLSVGLVLMLLCTLSIFAQNKVISVSGRVVESDSKEPAAQATVQLLSLPDSAYAAGIASSNKGWFTLPKVKAGKYLLKISYIGFRTKFVPVQLSNNVPEKKMGNIALEPDAVMLSEAVITGTAPEVTAKNSLPSTIIFLTSLPLILTLPSSSISAPGSFFTNSSSMAPSGVR